MMGIRYLLLCLLALSLYGCPGPYADYNFKITGMQAYNGDNGGYIPIDKNDTVNAKAYCIRLHIKKQLLEETKGQDPYESSAVDNDPLTNFKIISLNYFDTLVGAGGLLNDYFLFAKYNVYNSSNTVKAMITNRQLGTGIDVRKGETEGDNYLFLMVEPENPGNYTFVTTAYFTNGNTLTDTVSIYLK